jgi:hypothetical protein
MKEMYNIENYKRLFTGRSIITDRFHIHHEIMVLEESFQQIHNQSPKYPKLRLENKIDLFELKTKNNSP